MTLQYSPDSYASALVAIRSYIDAAQEALMLAGAAAQELAQTPWDDFPKVRELSNRVLTHANGDALQCVRREAMGLHNAAHRADAKNRLQIVAGRDYQEEV
jgi:hypothetical protein